MKSKGYLYFLISIIISCFTMLWMLEWDTMGGPNGIAKMTFDYIGIVNGYGDIIKYFLSLVFAVVALAFTNKCKHKKIATVGRIISFIPLICSCIAIITLLILVIHSPLKTSRHMIYSTNMKSRTESIIKRRVVGKSFTKITLEPAPEIFDRVEFGRIKREKDQTKGGCTRKGEQFVFSME